MLAIAAQAMLSAQNDSVSAADAALTRSAADARRYLLPAQDFLRSASRVKRVTQVYHRALFAVERRTTVVCYGMVTAEAEPVAPPDPMKIDPWVEDSQRIAETSRVVIICRECSGRGDVPCPDIHRKKHEACSDCGTTGRVAGLRGDKKCLRCRGTGTLGCRTCQGGFIPCLPCGAKGRKATWLEIQSEKYVRVIAESQHPLARMHACLLHPGDFDHGPWPCQKLADERCAGLPVNWPAILQPQLDARTERVVATRVQIFGQAQLRIHYGTALGDGALVFDERGNGPLPGSNLRPLIFRKRLLQLVAVGGFLLAVIYAWRYTAQHEWFSTVGHGGWILLLGLFAALFAVSTTFEATLPKSAVRRWRLLLPGALTGILCAAVLLLSAIDKPSGARAESALLQGDLSRARLEAEALQATHRDIESSAAVLDKLHLRQLRETHDLEQRASIAETPWFTPGLQDQALGQVQQESAELLEQAIRTHDIEQLKALEQLTKNRFPELHQRAGQHVAIERARKCLKSRDAECVLRETKQAEDLGMSAEVTSPLKASARAALHDDFAAAMRSVRASKRLTESRDALAAALKAAGRLASLAGDTSQPSQDELAAKLEKITNRIERTKKRDRR